MDTVTQHCQVVLLICGLMSDITVVIHFVYKCWIHDGQKLAGKILIEEMFKEVGLSVPKDLLHNQWINYYDHDDTTPVYVPSRWYWFKKMKVNVLCNIQHRITDPPQCTLTILEPIQTVSKGLLSICHKICQHQAARQLDISGVFCKYLPEPHVFTISRNTEELRIRYCKLPPETLSHLMQQINQCSTLCVLDLSGTTLTGRLSCFLPDSHPGLPKLQKLNMHGSKLDKDDLQHFSHITQCNKLPLLRYLDVSDNILRGCLTGVLSYTCPGVPALESLTISGTVLNRGDLQHFKHITQGNNFTKLQQLNLSWNTLTGCLYIILSDPYPGLPELQRLKLRGTGLNKVDLQYLLSIANKLPKLKELDLSNNTLTGYLSSFLQENQPGFPGLEKLHLRHTRLNAADLQHLVRVMQIHKLPRLDTLSLVFDKLYGVDIDVENLIKACVTHHQKQMKLKLWYRDISHVFVKKLEQQCAGTKIKLDLYRYFVAGSRSQTRRIKSETS